MTSNNYSYVEIEHVDKILHEDSVETIEDVTESGISSVSHELNCDIKSPQECIFLIINGIRDHGGQTRTISSAIHAVTGCSVNVSRIPQIDLIHFFSDVFFETHDSYVASIRDDIVAIWKEHPGKKLIIIAYSYGTFLLSKYFEKYPSTEATLIVLCGAIVREDFPWSEFTPNVREIVSECGLKDQQVIKAGSLSRRFGWSGRDGFRDDKVWNRYHQFATHSVYTFGSGANNVKDYTDRVKAFIVPLLENKLPTTLQIPPPWDEEDIKVRDCYKWGWVALVGSSRIIRAVRYIFGRCYLRY